MRDYIYFILFFGGFIWAVYKRIGFERKKPNGKDADYLSLYRNHSTLLILLFLVLTIKEGKAVLSELIHLFQ